MKSTAFMVSSAFVMIVGSAARGDVLYSQPPIASGTLLASAYWDPDGSDYDEFVWDRFVLPAAGNITEIQWRGGGSPVNEFEVSIWASIPVGTQPDVGNINGGRLLHRMTGNNAGQTFAGTFGGVAMYDHHYVLPQPFPAAANTPYWVQIIAWTPSWPSWGLATATGGNGNHFHRGLAVTGDYSFYFAGGDAAFKLIGTPVACSSPVITQQPQPVSVCFMGPNVYFSVVASGTGPFTYQWRRNSYPVNDGPNGGGTGGGALISGATTANLTIAQPSYYAQPGIYDCVVSNVCGPTASAGAQLDVGFSAPTISTNPLPATTCIGRTATFSIAPDVPSLTYFWRKNWGPALVDGPTADGSFVTGASTATLTITNIQPADVATYGCTVTNGCQANSTGAALSVFGAMPGDVNGDGAVNGGDIQPFVTLLLSGGPVSQGACAADMIPDGIVNANDVPAFVNQLLGL